MNIYKMKALLTVFFLICFTSIAISQEKEVIKTPIQESGLGAKSSVSEEVGMPQENLARNAAAISVGDHDVGTPSGSTFQLGTDITGTIQNSINQATGKVAFSVPLSAINAGPVSYSLGIGYNGQSSFKNGSQLNKYSPVSTIGVGWSLPISKIVVNNKQTTTREDDDFYLIDGATNTKLICTDRTEYVWEFALEKHANWIIKYHRGFDIIVQDPITGQFEIVFKDEDYWSIIKDDGITHYFGYADNTQFNAPLPNESSKSKEVVSTWGNWIGDSNQQPTGVSTTVWNISRIEDQWGNRLDFEYELTEGKQNISQSSHKHTEASYLTEITSSKGAKIKLNYSLKNAFSEFYEPHREISEPDAYQERYEKKFLQSVEIFNTNNKVVMSYDFSHNIESIGSNNKRYLTGITQKNHYQGQINSLPSQTFEYHYSGTFQGGLKKINYPSGGSVTYNYLNKSLFYNGSTIQNGITGYAFYAANVHNNYSLLVLHSQDPIGSTGKYRFKIKRIWWNGQQWEEDIFTFPHLIALDGNNYVKDFYAVFEEDFYGFAYDTGDRADLFLFHKEKNGHDWKYTSFSSNHIGSGNPSLLSGDNFIALASHHTGRIWIKTWNGTTWYSKLIQQGSGQYYYAARNNFILALDEDGGADMITGVGHEDNYYMHYLDIEHQWKTKSWSAYAYPRIHGIEKPSYFFPSNAISGFVADDNPELFLRWDSSYNLIAVDDVIGSYDDRNPLIPSGNSGMFTLLDFFYKSPIKSRRFNGVNWANGDVGGSSYYGATNFGVDFMTFQDHPGLNTGYLKYNPNFNIFEWGSLNSTGISSNHTGNGITRDFIVAGNEIFANNTQGGPSLLSPIASIGNYINKFTYTDGLSQAYVQKYTTSNNFAGATYLYVDKKNGFVGQKDLGMKYQINYNTFGRNKAFGGNYPFLSPKTMWLRSESVNGSFNPYLYRIIDNSFNEQVYDIVVSSIKLDDDNGSDRIVNYTYNDAYSSVNNDVTYYGEVIVENKGYGSNSIGKIKKIFNTGSQDVQMAGLQLEEHILDINNNIERKTINTWNKFIKNNTTGVSHYIGLTSKKEELFFDGNSLETLTNYNYNSNGQLISRYSTNSKGQTESQHFRYAHQHYSFVSDKNMISSVYETTTKLSNEIVDVKRTIWDNINNKVYIKEKWSGPELSKLRLDSEVTYVDSYGNLLEVTNGKNVYNSTLLGYSNLYEVASIVNARHQDVVNELDVNYSQLQNLSSENLKIELMKLYERLPNALISLTFYDDNGRVISRVNERKEEAYMYYDLNGRIDYLTDGYGNVLEKNDYNFGN
ncbi:hypothetical protein [Winogradskyella sp. PC D3.3]